MTTWVFRDEAFLRHDPGDWHVERPQRLEAVYASLDADPIPGLELRAPRRATGAELQRVHQPAMIERIARTADAPFTRIDPDTATCADSYDAALRAAGGVIEAVERVVGGEASGAFALVRPPGHHAESDRAMGFCLFNNVAVAAAHAVAAGGLERVLVLDPDVHHGNGTQHTFWDRADVLYISSHRYPFFPGSGAIDDLGHGKGAGYTVNLPLPASTRDADFLHVYRTVVGPVVRAYRPQLILVSAGFDTWQHDPLGGMRMTEAGFQALFALFRRWADEHCPGRIVCALEGGYDPDGLVAGVRAALRVLTAPEAPDAEVAGEVSDRIRDRFRGRAVSFDRRLG